MGLIALGFTYSIPLLLVVTAVSSSGTGVVRPVLTSLITQKADRSEQGVVLGLTQSIMSISQIIAPVIAGVLIDRGQLNAWALATAGVALMGMLVSLRSAA